MKNMRNIERKKERTSQKTKRKQGGKREIKTEYACVRVRERWRKVFENVHRQLLDNVRKRKVVCEQERKGEEKKRRERACTRE